MAQSVPLSCRVDTRSVAATPLLKQVLVAKGWTVTEDSGDYNVWWRTHRFAPIHIKHCRYPRQRLNHFNGTQVFCKPRVVAVVRLFITICSAAWLLSAVYIDVMLMSVDQRAPVWR